MVLALSDRDNQIRALESISQSLDASDIERHVREAKLESDQRLQNLDSRVEESRDLVEELRQDVQRLDGSVARDVDLLWDELVAPTVQLAGVSTVGSGVLLRSRETATAGEYETLLITAWHVVRDIIAESGESRPPIPVAIHHSDGTIRRETATLLQNDVGLDVALLVLDTPLPVAHGAVLANRDRLKSVRTFERIYAVGCPLGNDPIPTPGEIAHPRHRVDGSTYWMISAPTYIGNSGGPIFDAETFELLGIFSKIYTHGSLRPTVVPHMGLVTPLHLVYDWLEELEGEELTAAPGTPASLTIVHKSAASAPASLAFQRSEPAPSSASR
jgi:S1-C subfamily serine protease